MFKRTKVALRSSNKKSCLYRLIHTDKLVFANDITQHESSTIQELNQRGYQAVNLDFLSKKQPKIIATTDEDLGEVKYTEAGNVINGGVPIKYPQPTESFLKKYAKAYNKGKQIKQVYIEYVCGGRFESFREMKLFTPHPLLGLGTNTVVIKLIKNKFSKNDFKNALHKIELKYNKDYSELWDEIEINLNKLKKI